MNPPKSISAIRFFFVCLSTLFCSSLFAQLGKDGAKVISVPNTIVNDYTTLTSNANAGNTSIQVANNSLNSSFASTLTTGDLIFILQVQGAVIDTPDDSTYGNITSYQNCGNSEFAEVASVSGSNTISLACALQYNYTSNGKVVIVRVPRFASLTVNGGTSVTCPAWNGTTGGILVIEVFGTTIINNGGTIDVSGKGFRGGALINSSSAYGVLNFKWPANTYGAQKGESVAGSVTDYDAIGGRYCKGAPANGGGGGNGHNAGGGGGGNGGNIASYTGKGVPDISTASWANAWNLESPGFATSSSSGGGKGGYTFSDNNQNALVVGPFNPLWGGDQRRESGGRGGRPLDYSTGKIFLGGGGGAGEENNSKGGAGGIGGGLCYIYSHASVSGSGQILANGSNGGSTTTTTGTDGAGGGGAGGTVFINTTGTITGITINANGGNGGSQVVTFLTQETEGPGGGGGGGYIAISTGAVTRNTNGGANGTTNANSLSEFPSNGATKGNSGINNASLTTFRILSQTVSICSGTTTTLNVNTQGPVPSGVTYSWYDQASGGPVLATGISYTTPILSAAHTYYVSSCPGFARIPIQVNTNSAPSATFSSNIVCTGAQTNFSASGSPGINSWSWNFGDASPLSTQQNPSHTYTAGGTYSVTLTVGNGSCTSSVTQNAIVNNSPTVSFTSSAQSSGCGPLAVQFTNASTNATGYSWNFGDASSLNTQTNPLHTYSTGGVYTVVLTASNSGCTSTHSITVSVGASPKASFTSNNFICQNDTVFFVNQSQGNGSVISSYDWNFGDGSAHSSSLSPSHIYSGTGTFNVRLITTTALCSDDTVIAITVSAAPVANFSTLTTSGCAPLSVSFSNSTTGSPVYNWNFGDGSPSSNSANPIHVYSSPGTYTVKLIATQGSCADTIQQSNLINVSIGPLSSFSTTNVCAGDSVRFSNLSNGNGNPIISYLWNYGDGNSGSGLSPSHYYTLSGVYNVRLTANTSVCSDDTIISVTVNALPVNNFTSSISQACDSATVHFTNSSTGATIYSWIFGDGGTSSSTSPNHTYTTPGSYTVVLTATGPGSCSTTRASLNMVNVHSSPATTFSSSSTNFCVNECISFSAQSSPDVNSWTWTFPGGSPSSASGQNPGTVCYNASGNYDATLLVSNGFCESILTVASMIHAADCSVIPKANFISSDTVFCSGSCINFADLSTNAISWNWSFPGATPSSSTDEHPMSICYGNIGSYNVTLIVGNTAGNDTIEYNNFIQAMPPPVTPTITVNGNIMSSTAATQYQWNFNNIPVSGANSQQFSAGLAGFYSVTITDVNGCTSTSLSTYYSLTNIREEESNLLFYIYPNPASDDVSVMISSKTPLKLTVSLYDILGRKLISEKFTMLSVNENFDFSLKEYIPGMYFLELQSEDHKFIRPILRQ